MRRQLLTLLLLLNYLLVVCVSVAEQPARPAARPFDYAHSPRCQLKNAWRGGVCFDDCNGVQYHVEKGRKPIPLAQLLTMLKGLDTHCLPTALPVASGRFFGRARSQWARCGDRAPSGISGQIYQPPRWG